MATSTYTGNVASALSLDSLRTVSLSGGGGAQDYISSVVATLFMSTNIYSNYYDVTAVLANSGGSTLATSNRTDIKFDSGNYGGAAWTFTFSTGFAVNDIASVKLSAASNGDKIFVKDDQSVVVTYTVYTACGAPTGASLSASLAESDPTLYWSGAYAGAANGITGYEIQTNWSANGSTWGDWIAHKAVSSGGTSGSTSVSLPDTRGWYAVFRIRTQGSAGSSYYSAWAYHGGTVRYNSIPTELTTFSATPAVYVSGTISLTYSGATDADNNISTYNVSYATSADGTTWSGWTALANGATSHTPTLSPGHYIKYAARPVDAFGVSPVNWLESNVCGKNTAPAAPAITYPQDSKTIYNSRPRFLVTMGADPESHAQSIAALGFTASTASGLAGSAKTILRLTSAASAGTVSISAVSTDLYAESSSAAARSTTYAVPSFTDATIEGGTTAIKAAHMTELRTMINTVRAYYGLSAVSWAETITAGVTKARNWAAHIVEMQDAVDDVVALVNGWDTASTANRITAPVWIAGGSKPSAAVMEQIRATIPLL